MINPEAIVLASIDLEQLARLHQSPGGQARVESH